MTRKQLIERKTLRQQELVSNAKNEGNRDLTEEEKREFETLQFEIDLLKSIGNEIGDGNDLSGTESERALTAERTRIKEINDLCREFGLDVTEHIEKGTTIDDVKSLILRNIKENGAPISAKVTKDAGDKFREAAADALILRSGINLEKPVEGAKELRSLSLRDMAIECMANDSGEVGLNRRSSDELYTMLMQRQYLSPTASFPSILDTAIEKSYIQGHNSVPVTFDQWTKKGSLKDFKTHDNYYLAGPAGEFLEVPEGGELKHDTRTDEKLPTRKLRTYGRQFTLTRQAFINDDIELVTELPARYAKSARKTINKQCYQVLVNNPVTYDGVSLFYPTHKNILASGTGVTQASMQAMIMALQTQTDQFGESIIIRPATVIVPVGCEFDMYTLFFSPTINTSGNTQAANPLYRYKDMIKVIEDPTINVLCGGFGNQMPWWLVGSNDDTDFIEVDYLNGEEIPKIRRMETPGTLGFVWDIYLDWGISVMDYRGAIKNPGTVINNPLA